MPLTIPDDVKEELANLNESLSKFEDIDEFFTKNRPQYESLKLLDKARMELASLFTINSLYWIYLRCKGQDPSEDPNLAAELNRTKEYLCKLKQFDEAHKRPRYEAKTVGRFVRNAMFDINEETGTSTISGGHSESESVEVAENDDELEIIENETQHSSTKKKRRTR